MHDPEGYYWERMREAHQLRQQAAGLRTEAERIENDVLKELGLEAHPREPGFPQWWHPELHRYYDTPADALAALRVERLKGEGL